MKTSGIVVSMLSVLILSGACNNKKSTPTATSASKKEAVISISEQDFSAKIGDYNATPETFKYKGKLPCIVDFYATWCPPCKILSPIMDSLAIKYKDKVVMYRIDIDKNNAIASAFGIQAIPTLLWIPVHEKPFMTQGLMQQADMESTINNRLLK